MKTILNVFATLLLMAATGSNVMAETEATFDKLDLNKDGQVSIGEGVKDSSLNAMWSTVDADKNGMIDRTEFSAFESLQQQSEPYDEAPAEAPGAAQ